MLLRVVIKCPHPEVAYEGEWEASGPEDVLRHCVDQAITLGVPIHLEVKGHGAWNITRSGKATPDARFLKSPN